MASTCTQCVNSKISNNPTGEAKSQPIRSQLGPWGTQSRSFCGTRVAHRTMKHRGLSLTSGALAHGRKPRILRFVLQRMEKVDNLPGICNIYMLKCWCVPVYANGQDVKVLEHLCHWWQRRRRGAMQGEWSIQSKTYPSVMAERFCTERDGQTVRLAPFVRLFRTFV